jgi:hypothetical protein
MPGVMLMFGGRQTFATYGTVFEQVGHFAVNGASADRRVEGP